MYIISYIFGIIQVCFPGEEYISLLSKVEELIIGFLVDVTIESVSLSSLSQLHMHLPELLQLFVDSVEFLHQLIQWLISVQLIS